MVLIGGAILATFGAIVTVGGGLFGFYFFPDLVTERIVEMVQLRNGSDAYERWENIPVPISYKFYFFNVTNPSEVQSGAKPIVTEIGPFVYNEYRSRVNVTLDEPDILTYYENRFFEFDEEASAPLTEYDEITIVHFPLMAVATMTEHVSITGFAELLTLNTAIPTIFANPTSVFLRTTPRAFLFDGIHIYCNTTSIVPRIACNRIATMVPETMPQFDDGSFRFALLGYKNKTVNDEFSINNGLQDISLLGQVLTWRNSSTVDAWPEYGTCNDIYGTDTTIFPPSVGPESKLNIFYKEICRSLPIRYESEVVFSEISADRFVVGEDVLASPSNNPANECFCLNRTRGIRGTDGCLLDGAVELWDCQGAPVVLTLPHFYRAHEDYQNGVEGLSPNKLLHQVFVDLEPMTGTVLRGSIRAQLNIFIRPIERIALTTNLETTLMPIFWMDEGVELDEARITELNESLFSVLNIWTIVIWILVCSGLVFLILGMIWLIMSYRRNKKTH